MRCLLAFKEVFPLSGVLAPESIYLSKESGLSLLVN